MLGAALAVASCDSGSADGGGDTPTPTPSIECTPGLADRPTEISRLTLDGVTTDAFATTLTVPFGGLENGPLDRPSVVRAAVVTSEWGAPVTFRTDSGAVIADLGADWLAAGQEITVISERDETGCSAGVYLFSTEVGSLTLSASSDGSLSTTVDVVTASSAARDLSLTVDATEVTSGDDLDVVVTATDVFGNRVAGTTIVISVPAQAPARYPNGSNRAIVLTDDDGRAKVRLLTDTDRTRTFRIRARGVDPRCTAAGLTAVNQYGCGSDEPFIGAAEPMSDVRVPVTVRAPAVDVEAAADAEAASRLDDEDDGAVSPRSARR